MSKYFSLLTNIGKAQFANATILNKKVDFANIVVSSSNEEISEEMETLKDIRYKAAISKVEKHENNNSWVVVESVVPSNIGGFTISTVGITDAQDNLLAVAKYPQTYKPSLQEGAGKDLVIRFILEVSNSDTVTLKVDPSIVIATLKDLEKLKNSLQPQSPQEIIENIKSEEVFALKSHTHPIAENFYNHINIAGTHKQTLFNEDGSILEKIISNNKKVSEKLTTFQEGGISVNLKVYREDGESILKESTVVTSFESDGSIAEEVQ